MSLFESRWRTVLLVIFASFVTGAKGELKVASIFSDEAVLQRDAELPVWGDATPGSEISVSLNGKSAKSMADESGRWEVRLPEFSADGKSHTLTIQSTKDKNSIKFNDVIFGDVWLCSGQSNMAMRVSRSDNPEKETADADLPDLRVFTVARKASPTPVQDCEGRWEKSSPEIAGNFSATAFFFGREIHREVGVPVGLIVSAWSGSAIEAWTSREAQEKTPILKPLLDSWKSKISDYTPEIAAKEKMDYQRDLDAWRKAAKTAKETGENPPKKPRPIVDPRTHHHSPAVLFNGMIQPLIPYAIRGAIWYQGETNGATAAAAKLYGDQLPLLIKDWRTRWGQGDFPMAWMQLPHIRAQQVDWATVREAMRRTQTTVQNTGMAVTIDLPTGDLLHPTNKQDYAHRLALWARSEVYGTDIPWSGPLAKNARFDGSVATIQFDHVDGGFKKRGETESLTGFELFQSEKGWEAAEATISGNAIRIESQSIPAPKAVRYAWSNQAEATLFNDAKLPASPFLLGDVDATHKKEATAAQPKPRPSQTPAPTNPPLEEAEISQLPEGTKRLEIFLLMGQSNMKGRGVMPEKTFRDPRILMMHRKTEEWFLARHPLHLTGDPKTFKGHDNAGVGPGLAFAETLIRHRPDVAVALVPCAVGGTRIALWEKDAKLYKDAIRRAKLALNAAPKGKARIAGALWLQGEADSKDERVPLYAKALDGMITDLREELQIEKLPFLVSTIGEMRTDQGRKEINKILVDLPNRVPNTAAVDARDMNGHIGDLVHLNTPTQNEIGRRFARLFLKMQPGE